MCRTFSAFGLPNGDIIFNVNLDSHEDIKEYFGLKTETNIGKAQPIEFYPDDIRDFPNLKKYNLHFDNDYREDWVTDSMIKKWAVKLRAEIKQIIIDKDTRILTGSRYIIKGELKIYKTVNCEIIYCESATFENCEAATFKYCDSATFENCGYATFENKKSAKFLEDTDE